MLELVLALLLFLGLALVLSLNQFYPSFLVHPIYFAHVQPNLVLGQVALEKAARYASERVVFDRTIGKNQAIQHPLAENWMELQAAELMVFKAASLYDKGQPCGAEANASKYLAASAAHKACQRAVLTHGGMGYAKEYHVERYLREIMIPVIAPISQELIKSFIAEQVLGQEKSY